MENEQIIIEKPIGLKRELKTHKLILVDTNSDGFYIALDTLDRNTHERINRVIIAKAETAPDLHPIWTALIDVYSSGFADGMNS